MPPGQQLALDLVDYTFYNRALARLYCLVLYQTAELTFLARERDRIQEENPDHDLSWELYLRESDGDRYADLLQEQFNEVWLESRCLRLASGNYRYPRSLASALVH